MNNVKQNTYTQTNFKKGGIQQAGSNNSRQNQKQQRRKQVQSSLATADATEKATIHCSGKSSCINIYLMKRNSIGDDIKQ